LVTVFFPRQEAKTESRPGPAVSSCHAVVGRSSGPLLEAWCLGVSATAAWFSNLVGGEMDVFVVNGLPESIRYK
jgi:hypothetical protein